MLKVTNLKIQYSKLLFQELSFVLGNKEKIGLIGFNGSGKSTLLKIIANIEQADQGKVELVNEKIGYLPQEYSFSNHNNSSKVWVGEILESFVKNHRTDMYRVNRVLHQLEFKDINIYQEVNTLSFGQKIKLYLTKLLVEEATILLLDEPTNHLDIFGILWLENFIKTFNGICIIVSHDRAFINNVCNKIFEIDEQKLNIFNGNYDDFLNQKGKLLEKRENQYLLQEKKKEKFANMIERIRKQSAGEAQSKALRAVKTRITREVTKKEISIYKEQKIKELKLNGLTYKNKQIFKMKDVTFYYDTNKPLLRNVDFEIFGKERIWFYGANGIGKSTFVKLIMNEIKPNIGEIKVGENTKIIYFSQDQSHLPYNETVEEYFLQNTDVDYSKSFGILGNFMFDKETRKVKIGRLSPGQRARLSFATFSQKNYDFMILDEPTNHLDIKSKEVIEDALRSFQGSLLLISHDRYFVESIGINRWITIEEGRIVERLL